LRRMGCLPRTLADGGACPPLESGWNTLVSSGGASSVRPRSTHDSSSALALVAYPVSDNTCDAIFPSTAYLTRKLAATPSTLYLLLVFGSPSSPTAQPPSSPQLKRIERPARCPDSGRVGSSAFSSQGGAAIGLSPFGSEIPTSPNPDVGAVRRWRGAPVSIPSSSGGRGSPALTRTHQLEGHRGSRCMRPSMTHCLRPWRRKQHTHIVPALQPPPPSGR